MRRKSNIVPGLVLGASFTAVVPSVVVACSGQDPVTNLDNKFLGVAAVAYCCFEGGGVADVGFRPEAGDAAKEASDAANDAPADTATDAPADSPEGG